MDNRGFVYLIGFAELPGYYKIGMTIDIEKRLASLQTASPFNVVLVHKIKSPNARKLEQKLHKKFADKRTKREWFALSDNDVEKIKAMSNRPAQQTFSAQWITPNGMFMNGANQPDFLFNSLHAVQAMTANVTAFEGSDNE